MEHLKSYGNASQSLQQYAGDANRTNAGQTISQRISTIGIRLQECVDQSESVLQRIRGSMPTPITNEIRPPQSTPTVETMVCALFEIVGNLEARISELNKTI